MTTILTLKEAAEYLRCSSSTMYRLIERGTIPHFRVGTNYRFSGEELNKWMAAGQVDAGKL